MSLIKMSLIVILILFINHTFAMGNQNEEEEMTTMTMRESDIIEENKDSEKDVKCLTKSGLEGKCMDFGECFYFPSYEGSEEEINNPITTYVNETRDEIIQTLSNEICTGSSSVCCPWKFEEITENQDLLQNGDIYVASPDDKIFPSDCGIPNKTENPIEKITGGNVANKGQFPWMVALYFRNSQFLCGGTLINNNYVLTAAHCFIPVLMKLERISNFKLHIGDYDLKTHSDGFHEIRKISKLIVHGSFNTYRAPNDLKNDIALLKLDAPVKFTAGKIHPICIPSSEFNMNKVIGQNVVVTGWGKVKGSIFEFPQSVLRMVEVPMWDTEECKKAYGNNKRDAEQIIHPWTICAGDGNKNKDSCQGDSGGPLKYKIESKWTQLGIVSWGRGCGKLPGVYTSVQPYVPWIERQIRAN